jgi:pyruvate dehydrogenase (quinone)
MVVQKPVVLNVYTDPSVPMMPPHVSFDQFKSFASAIFKGDSDAWDIIKQTSKAVYDGYFPGK